MKETWDINLRQFFYYLRVIFFSFEFVILLIALWIITQQPAFMEPIFTRISIEGEDFRYIAFVPLTIFMWIFWKSNELLFPSEDEKKILQKWKHYNKLKSHFYVTFLWAIFFASASLIAFFMKIQPNILLGFCVYVFSIIGIIYVALSVYFAKIRIKEIFLSAKDE